MMTALVIVGVALLLLDLIFTVVAVVWLAYHVDQLQSAIHDLKKHTGSPW